MEGRLGKFLRLNKHNLKLGGGVYVYNLVVLVEERLSERSE